MLNNNENKNKIKTAEIKNELNQFNIYISIKYIFYNVKQM